MALLRPLLVLTVCLFALHKTALGQENGEQDSPIACDMRSELVHYLQEKYEERLIKWARFDKDSIEELFASPLQGTWSILRTYSSNASCLVRSGYVGPWSDL